MQVTSAVTSCPTQQIFLRGRELMRKERIRVTYLVTVTSHSKRYFLMLIDPLCTAPRPELLRPLVSIFLPPPSTSPQSLAPASGSSGQRRQPWGNPKETAPGRSPATSPPQQFAGAKASFYSNPSPPQYPAPGRAPPPTPRRRRTCIPGAWKDPLPSPR